MSVPYNCYIFLTSISVHNTNHTFLGGGEEGGASCLGSGKLASACNTLAVSRSPSEERTNRYKTRNFSNKITDFFTVVNRFRGLLGFAGDGGFVKHKQVFLTYLPI